MQECLDRKRYGVSSECAGVVDNHLALEGEKGVPASEEVLVIGRAVKFGVGMISRNTRRLFFC
jgi:hypothetical protein